MREKLREWDKEERVSKKRYIDSDMMEKRKNKERKPRFQKC